MSYVGHMFLMPCPAPVKKMIGMSLMIRMSRMIMMIMMIRMIEM